MLTRILAFLFPSVPPADQARVLAAMEGRTYQSPVVGARGSASAAGQSPEDGDGCSPSTGPSPFSGPPACETALYWRPHPSRTTEFTDEWLGHLLDRWGAPS